MENDFKTKVDKLGLSTKALQLATERPRLWEYKLFAQVIIDEVETVKKYFSKVIAHKM